MYKKTILNICFIFGMSFLLSACEPHRIDIQQGNQVKPELLAKLELGMTRKQVLFLLGTPLLKDPFHQDRWDYIYYMKPGNGEVEFSRVTLFFNGSVLQKIDDSEYLPTKESSNNDATDTETDE